MNRRAFGKTALHTALMLSAPGWLPAVARAAAPPGPNGFPSKPLRAVVPYPAGGVVDVTLRPAIDRMSLDLPQRVVVENRPGADGRIAIEYAIRAPADGYTILAVTPVLAVAQSLYPNSGIRVQSFRAIGGVAAVPSVFVVHESVPVKTLKEFATWAKARPGEVNVPVPGNGSSLHLAQELFFESMLRLNGQHLALRIQKLHITLICTQKLYRGGQHLLQAIVQRAHSPEPRTRCIQLHESFSFIGKLRLAFTKGHVVAESVNGKG